MNNNVKKSLINEAFNQLDISNTLKERINVNSKKLLINDTLKKSMIKNILKEPTMNNNKLLINNILNDNNKKTTLEKTKINNNINILKESRINDNLEKPKTNKKSTKINKKPETNKNLEELRINILNKQAIINDNLKKPKINNNILNEQSKTINNLEESKVNNKNLEKTKINNNKLSITIIDSEEEKITNNRRSDYVKIPEFLVSKKLIINPPTKDNKSFLDSVTHSLHHKSIGKNNTRPNKIRKYSDTFNWKNINFPPTHEDYKQFEIDNKEVNLNILTIKRDEIDYIYKSRFESAGKYKANLLLLENKYYTCVKNLDSLLIYS